jgi:hypothetical protein
MAGRLSSHRFRRRVAWLGVSIAVLGVVVGGSMWIGNTGRTIETPLSDEAASVYEEPPVHPLTRAERTRVFETSMHFVRTAVARRNLDDAWELLGPEMQAGQTRKSWNTGSNNVVPFPAAGVAAWDVLYSYDDDVALDLALVATPGGDTVGKSFTIELKRYPARGDRWLVASWVPRGISGPGQSRAAAAAPEPPAPRAPLSAIWLAVPLSILGLVVLIPALLAVRSFVQHRRAARRYERELGGYTSSSSPS